MNTRVKLLGGMQMWTMLKLLRGIQPNYWGDISPHPPLFRHPWVQQIKPAGVSRPQDRKDAGPSLDNIGLRVHHLVKIPEHL